MRELRPGQPAGRRLLQRLWRAARDDRSSARGTQDGHGVVLRRGRVDGAGGADGSGSAAGAVGALLRADESDCRVARRHGGEVHRRCGDGGVRHPRGARGRRAAGLPGRGGDARRVAGAGDPRPGRGQHGRDCDRHVGAACDRGRGQCRGAVRAGCGAGGGPDRRGDARAGAPGCGGGAGGAVDAEGEVGAGSGVQAHLGAGCAGAQPHVAVRRPRAGTCADRGGVGAGSSPGALRAG
jgi:hypothetical protein